MKFETFSSRDTNTMCTHEFETYFILLNRMNTTRICGYCESGYVNGYSLKMYVFQNLEHSWSWSGDLRFSSLSNLGGAIETCEYQIGSQLNCGRASRRNRRNRFSEVVHSKERDLGRAGFMESPCVERGRDCPRQYRLVRGGFNTQCVVLFSRFSPQQHESSNSYRSVICGENGIEGRKIKTLIFGHCTVCCNYQKKKE